LVCKMVNFRKSSVSSAAKGKAPPASIKDEKEVFCKNSRLCICLFLMIGKNNSTVHFTFDNLPLLVHFFDAADKNFPHQVSRFGSGQIGKKIAAGISKSNKI